MKVITYRLAYVPGEVSLCQRHEGVDGYGVLGAVQHGSHDGYCAECDLIERRAESRRGRRERDDLAISVDASGAPVMVRR